MEAFSATIYHHIPPAYRPGYRNFPKTYALQKVQINYTHTNTKSGNRLVKSLSNLLHLHLETPAQNHVNLSDQSLFQFNNDKDNTPNASPKEDISKKWREMRGHYDLENVHNLLQPWLRREILKYGEFAQATYDSFDFDSLSEYCGSCRFNRHRFFEKLGLQNQGYKVSKYIYAMSHVEMHYKKNLLSRQKFSDEAKICRVNVILTDESMMPRWLEKSRVSQTWSRDSNWMGFVAVSDDEETKRIGRRDIVVAWRGTVAPSEWYQDLQGKLEPIGDDEAKVEHGFHSIYTSKSDTTRYNKLSASEQVMNEIKKLVQLYKGRGEEVSLTITGHSLGGALALLNAYEAASTLPGLPISVISFGAPRVGNIAFRDEISQMGVKTLRVVLKQDVIPHMPGIIFNESLEKLDDITGTLDWVYTHVGSELVLDVSSSPYLKRGFNLVGYHMLETYLHLVDGFFSKSSTYRADAKRDVTLVNKSCDMLVDELRIPVSWYQLENKGLVCNSHGRWVKPRREFIDIPSPASKEVESYRYN